MQTFTMRSESGRPYGQVAARGLAGRTVALTVQRCADDGALYLVAVDEETGATHALRSLAEAGGLVAPAVPVPKAKGNRKPA